MLSKFFVASAVFILAFIAVAVLAFTDNDALISKEVADVVNSIPGKTWTASHEQGDMTGATTAQIKRLCGVKRNAPIKLQRKFFEKKVSLPSRFESAEKWPQCPTITKIVDQSACGSCWCMSSASAMSDRLCTYGVHQNMSISCAQIMECCWMCGQGCNGGQPEAAFEYANYNGVVTDQCQPYPFPSCAHHVKEAGVPPCPSQEYQTPSCPGAGVCTNNQSNVPFQKHYFEQAYSLMGEEDYMQELMTNGPFAVAFSVYSDFPVYKGGVYRHTSGTYLGGHAVRVVGWGELNGEKYWKIANSWNSGWGMNGYFLIARGVNECGIEESGAAGAPKGSN